MSMFKVYGVTIEVARKKAEKKFDTMPLKFKQEFNPEKYEQWVKDEAEAFFNRMSPVAIGKPLDAPQFAEDLIALTKKQHVAALCMLGRMCQKQTLKVA